MNPAPLRDATNGNRGAMTAAHVVELEALRTDVGGLESDVGDLGADVGALEAAAHPAVTVSSPAGWLSLAGQALTFALVAASSVVAGVVDTAAQTFLGVKTFTNAIFAVAGVYLGATGVKFGEYDGVTGGFLYRTAIGELGLSNANGAAGIFFSLANGIGRVTGTFNIGGKVTSGQGATVTGAAVGTVVALTSSAASMAIDLSAANNFSHTLTENTTLAAPTNPVAGQSGVIVFTQHASSPKTLAFNSFWKFAGGTVPTLTATNGAVDTFTYYVESTGRATCALIKDVK